MHKVIKIVIAVAIIALGWFSWPFFQSASKQAQVKHLALFERASKRDWKSAADFLSPTYEDQWGNKPSEAIETARELLQGFLVLEIKWDTLELTQNENLVKVRGHARMEGNGMGLSQMVMTKVNQIQEPWVFTWEKTGWKPGDWKLISVTNKDLEGMGLPKDF